MAMGGGLPVSEKGFADSPVVSKGHSFFILQRTKGIFFCPHVQEHLHQDKNKQTQEVAFNKFQ
ncbi:MAG: hypothetical protein HC848_01180 [Limnobacter sp.]|nr:hypothetical protein [Limnobacter sp.]